MTQRRNAQPNYWIMLPALIWSGLAIGWLAGLSVSPVVSIVLTSVTGLAAAIVTALSGLREEPDDLKPNARRALPKFEVWPLALLLFGMVFGAAFGISARNNHLFGSDVTSEIKKWADVGVPEEAVMERLFGRTATYSPYTQPYTQTLQIEIDRWTNLGIPKDQVVNRLFEQYFAASQVSTKTTTLDVDNRLGSYLFAKDAVECKALLAAAKMATAMADDTQMTKALRASTITQLHTLPDLVADPETLKLIVEEVLCADG